MQASCSAIRLMRRSAGVGTRAALALALVLAMAMGSCVSVTHGARTTPSSAADGLQLQPGRETPPPAGAAGRRHHGGHAASTSQQEKRGQATQEGEDEQQMATKEGGVTGSRLPDCAHACGPCAPCKRVMVSFRCAAEASESCPIAYRCMCRGKFFRVPTL